MALRVYYEDTDFSGFVYHARYLAFFERARTEALRAQGVDQRALHEAPGGPFGFVVKTLKVEYLHPARMDDWLEAETLLIELGAARLLMGQRLFRGERLLASAEVVLAFVAKGRPARLVPPLRAALQGLIAPEA